MCHHTHISLVAQNVLYTYRCVPVIVLIGWRYLCVPSVNIHTYKRTERKITIIGVVQLHFILLRNDPNNCVTEVSDEIFDE